jgi:hypothetical protein
MKSKFGWIHSATTLARPFTAAPQAAEQDTIIMATTVVTPAIPTPVSPTPTGNGFKNFMHSVGHKFQQVFAYLGSPKGQASITAIEGATTGIVTAINPGAGAVLVGVEALFNAGLRSAVTIESIAAAAGAQDGTGAQKAAAFTASLASQIGAFLQSIGVANPKAEQIQSISTALSGGVVAVLNSIPAPIETVTPAQ